MLYGSCALKSIATLSGDRRNRIMDQTKTLRQLEIIRRMILESENRHPGSPLPDSLRTVVDQISVLYKPAEKGAPLRFKINVYPPLWTWKNLHLL